MEIALNELFAGLQLRPATKHLVACLLADSPLTPAVLIDFGVDSPDHYRALRAVFLTAPTSHEPEMAEVRAWEAWRQRIAELERALGHGQRLNALVRKYAPEYSDRVHFHTEWDALTGSEPEEP
jgi:hypothetical protein